MSDEPIRNGEIRNEGEKMETKILENNRFEFEGSIVTCQKVRDNIISFTYKGLIETAIKSINPELYDKILSAVIAFNTEREKILEQRRVEERQKLLIAKNLELTVFKSMVATEAPELLKYQNVRFQSFDIEDLSSDVKRIDVGDFSIRHDAEVWGRGSWHKHTTNRPWVLQTSDYKNIRYAKFATAAQKLVEMINEKNAMTKRIQSTEEKMKTFAASCDMTYKKEYKYSPFSRKNSESDTMFVELKSGTKITSNLYMDSSGNVYATSPKIYLHVDFKTPEQVKKVVKKIEEVQE